MQRRADVQPAHRFHPERVRFHQQLHQLFLDMGLALEEADADEAMRTTISREMGQKLHEFVQTAWSDPDCQRLAKRILKHTDELLVWLTNPAVSPDNNEAKRALRPAVVTSKTSLGSCSKAGARAYYPSSRHGKGKVSTSSKRLAQQSQHPQLTKVLRGCRFQFTLGYRINPFYPAPWDFVKSCGTQKGRQDCARARADPYRPLISFSGNSGRA